MAKVSVYKLDEVQNLREIDRLKKEYEALEVKEHRVMDEGAQVRRKIAALGPILTLIEMEEK